MVVGRRLSAPRSAGVGQSDHRGWGLGYVTLAADALGANRIGPRPAGDGSMTAGFELGTRRLALPIAVVDAFRVVDATPGWETEQGCPAVGTPITLEIERVVREAATHPVASQLCCKRQRRDSAVGASSATWAAGCTTGCTRSSCWRSRSVSPSPLAPVMMTSRTAQQRLRQRVSPGNRPMTVVRRRTSSSDRSSRLVRRRRRRNRPG